MRFKEWLAARKASDTPRGDFIRDARKDGGVPDLDSWERLHAHLCVRRACGEAVEQGRLLWNDYVRATKRKDFAAPLDNGDC